MTDPLIAAARFLLTQLEWLRHATDQGREPFAATALPEIDECLRIVRGIARGSRGRIYRGPCGAPVVVEHVDGDVRVTEETDTPCDGDVYAYPGADSGRCDKCQAEYPETERRPWLNGLVREYNYRAVHLSDAYNIPADTIRSWAHRGLLVAHGHDADGRPLYNAGEVQELRDAAEVRKAERAARRDRKGAA